MADVFVSEAGAGLADGSDADNPYSRAGHNGATLSAGDVVYVLGEITGSFIPPSSGSAGNPITYRFDHSSAAGSLSFSGAGTTLSIASKNYLTFETPLLTAGGTTAGILVSGTTAGIILNTPTVTCGNTRAIYFSGNAHTDWEINNPIVTAGTGAVDNAGARHAIYIFGNSATAGTGGVIKNPVLRSGATSVAKDASNFVGIHVDDWNNIRGDDEQGVDIDGFHTGIRYTNADSNSFKVKQIANCDNGGLKSDATGGGQGVLVELTSTLNDTFGGAFVSNYQGYVDASSVGGNRHYGAIHGTHTVNGVSLTAAGATLGLAANLTVNHSPTDTEGHGIVVQNGGASTNLKIVNNHIACDTTGTNVQAVAIAGTYDNVEINNNNYALSNSAVLGQLGVTEYTTLSAWQTALQGDANVSGEDANTTTQATRPRTGGVEWIAAGEPHPIGSDGEPFPRWDISIGGTQSKLVASHPNRL